MADGILAAVNENGNIDRFIDTKGGVHYIEPKRYEESVAKIDAAATKAKETVNSATEAVSECKAQTGACTQETARAKEIADTVESRITGIEGDVAALRDSVSPKLLATTKGTASAAIDVSGASLLVVVAKNNYVGITTATVPVAALSNNVDTVHLAGGYRASGLYSNYDCRMTLTTFTGRDAYTNGVDRAGETQWFVYRVL